MPFGTYIFSYMVCACLAVIIRRNWYERGSPSSKLLMVFLLVAVHTLIMTFLFKMVFEEVRWLDVLGSVWLPEMLATMLVALFVFKRLLDVARLFRF